MATAILEESPKKQPVLRSDGGPEIAGTCNHGHERTLLSDPLLAIVLSAVENGDADRGYRELANLLRDELCCHSVALGVRIGIRGKCVLKAISGVPHFKRHSPLASCAEEVLNEALLLNTIDQSDTSQSTSSATDSQKRLLQLCHVNQLVCGRVQDRQNRVIGAWVVLQDDPRCNDLENEPETPMETAVEELPSRLVRCFHLLERCQPRFWERARGPFVGDNGRLRRRIAMSIVGAFILLMVLPLRYSVKCDCEVQPITRRFVPVPYDGVLQEVLAEPGDVVQAHQTLARMDGREIQWELSALEAEYNQSKKQYDVQLAGRDTPAAQVARLEMERLSLQIQLHKHHAANLEIQSPITGIVISGDPKKKEYARLARGESLFEIGPLDRMVVDVLVPEEDIRHVQEGQEVNVRLDAFPGSPRQGQIRRVSPQAEVRDEANVFVAEVEFDNGDASLRPGMLGRGRIKTVRRPLVWNLFHRAWDGLVYHVAW